MQNDEEKRRKRNEIYKRWCERHREDYLNAQRRNRAKNGHKWKEKDRERTRLWRIANLEKARARELEYRKKNRARACAREKVRRLANPERKRAADAAYAAAHTREKKAYAAAYCAKNAARLKVQKRRWYMDNRASISEKSRAAYAADPSRKQAINKRSMARPEAKIKTRERRIRRRATDPQYKIAQSLRSRMKKCFSKEYRKGGTLALLGCSVKHAKKHLESLFQPGMSWANYGYHGWHIDHRIPLSSVDLTNPESIAKVCHYTNLQPLWKLDNIRKHNHLSVHIAAPP